MKLTKFFTASGFIIFLASCSTNNASQAPVGPPVQPSLDSIQSSYAKVARVDALNIRIEYDRSRFAKTAGRTFYFTAIILEASSGVARDFRIPSPHVTDIPTDLAATLASDLTNPRFSSQALQLAKLVAKRSICVNGMVAADDRPLKRPAPLTEEQRANVQGAVGGNLGALLTMTPGQLSGLGLADIMNPTETTRVQIVDYSDRTFVTPVVYLRCSL